jgi:hypothetical protein
LKTSYCYLSPLQRYRETLNPVYPTTAGGYNAPRKISWKLVKRKHGGKYEETKSMETEREREACQESKENESMV